MLTALIFKIYLHIILNRIFYLRFSLCICRVRPSENRLSVASELNNRYHTFCIFSILRITVDKFLRGILGQCNTAFFSSARIIAVHIPFHTVGNIHHQHHGRIGGNLDFLHFLRSYDLQIDVEDILRIRWSNCFRNLDFSIRCRFGRILCKTNKIAFLIHYGIFIPDLAAVVFGRSVLSRSIQIGNAAGKYYAGRQDQRKNLPCCFLQHKFFPFLWIFKAYLFIPGNT